ncbi:MAG: Rid family detoxifying hydrolase [Spirochaetales bacterium]|nr:Rid family detoxifying hydrolase [Spirochaetales bacterium]
MIERVNTPKAPKAVGPYSQAVKANGFLFISGMLALDPESGLMVGETAEEQTEMIFKNIKAVLDEAGARIENTVKAIVYLEDIKDFAAVNKVYGEAFKNAPVLPARCAFQVVKLPKDGKVEIELTVAL